jgi:hypothetical protein
MFKTCGFFVASSGPTNGAPVASNVAFTGTLQIGEVLAGSYDYSDPDGHPESGSLYQWYSADDGSGTNAAPIAGATTLTPTVTAEYMDKYIRLGVTPSDGEAFGTEAFSAWTQAWITNPLWQYTVFQTNFAGGTEGQTNFAGLDETGRHTTSRVGATAELDTGVILGNADASMLVTNVGSGIGCSDSDDWNYLNGPFTVRLFWRGTAAGNNNRRFLLGQGDSGASVIAGLVEVTNLNNLKFFANGANSFTGTATINVSQNYYFEITKDASNVYRTFIDGVKDVETTNANAIANITQNMAFGRCGDYTGFAAWGNLGPMAILKGYCLHTANFTPPAGPFDGQYMAP